MANQDVQLSLKIIGDAASAVRAMNDTLQKARETGIGIARTQSVLDALFKVGQIRSDLGTALDAARAKARDLGQQLVSAALARDQLKQVQSLVSLRDSLTAVSKAAGIANEDLAELKQLAKDTGANLPQIPKLERRATRLTGLAQAQTTQAIPLQESLAAAGIDTGNLASEAQRLQALSSRFEILKAQYREATAGIGSNQRAVAANSAEYERLRATLQAAGADLKALGEFQTDLAAKAAGAAAATEREAAALNRAQGLADARSRLGLIDPAAMRASVAEAIAAFNTIRNSGQASAAEISRAFLASTAQIRTAYSELRRLIPTGGSAVAREAGAFASSALQGAGVVLGGYGLVQGIKAISDAATEFQRYQITLKAVTGSQQEANAAFAFGKTLADTYGLSIGGTLKNLADFSAASKGTALEGAKGREVFGELAKTFTVLGLDASRQDEAFLALNQMLSKGTVQAQELRLQLGNALPGAFELMARAIGVTTAQLNELVTTGQLKAVDALRLLADEGIKEYGGSLPDALASARVAFQQLQNAAREAAATIGNDGVLDALSTIARSLSEQLRDPELLKSVAGISTELIKGFGFLVTHAEELIRFFLAFKGAAIGSDIGAVLGSFFGPLGTLIGEISGAGLGAILGDQLPSLIGKVGAAAAGATPELKDYQDRLKALAETQVQISSKLASLKLDSSFDGLSRAQISAKLKSQEGAAADDPELVKTRNYYQDLLLGNGGNLSAQAEAAFTKLKAGLAAAVEIVRANTSLQTAILDDQFSQNLIGYEDYYRRRAALEKQNVDQEIRQLSGQLGGLAVEQSKIASDTDKAGTAENIKKVAEIEGQRTTIQAQINALKTKELQIDAQTAGQIEAARKAAEAQFNQLRDQVAKQARDAQIVAETTRKELEQQYAELLTGPDKDKAAATRKFIDTEVTQAQFDTVKQQASDLVTNLDTLFASLSQGVQAGTTTTTEAQQQFATALAQSNPQLDELLARLRELAGNLPQDAGQAVDQLAQKIRGLALNARTPLQQLRAQWLDLTGNLQKATADFANDFVDRLANVVAGGKFQFRDFANFIVKELARIGFQKLIAGLFEGGGGGGGLGGLFAGLGGLLGSLGGPGSSFSDIGGAILGAVTGGFAGGGPITGSGSDTSDNILARVSPGEFIVNAASVRRLGLGFMNAVNRAADVGMPRFATGGFVGSALAGGGFGPSVSITQSFDFRGAGPDQLAQLHAYGEQIKRDTVKAVFDAQKRGYAPK